jgi:hypothetical protein
MAKNQRKAGKNQRKREPMISEEDRLRMANETKFGELSIAQIGRLVEHLAAVIVGDVWKRCDDDDKDNGNGDANENNGGRDTSNKRRAKARPRKKS